MKVDATAVGETTPRVAFHSQYTAFWGKTRSAKMPIQLFKVRGFLMAFQDKTLVCKECGKEFVFTAGEQEFYAEKGFENEPIRCKDCRDARKKKMNGNGQRKQNRQMYEAVCADCGATTQVPFKPRNDRPVYCSECYQNHHTAQNGY
nr:zinc-ribbon domain containing protein [Tepidanaerobacter syntrophicus]